MLVNKFIRLIKLPLFWLIILVIIFLTTLVYAFLGFGYIKVDPYVVFINENRFDNKTKFKLRPGTYTVRYAGNQLDNQPVEVKVLPFTSKYITVEKIQPLDIIRSATNGPIDFEINSFEYKQGEYFFDNNWFVAEYINPNNSKRYVAAFQYVYDQWQTRLFYPNDTPYENYDHLPSEVKDFYINLRKSYALD